MTEKAENFATFENFIEKDYWQEIKEDPLFFNDIVKADNYLEEKRSLYGTQ